VGSCRRVWVVLAILAAGCGEAPTAPTYPQAQLPPATPPIVNSISVSVTRTEVEQDVIVTAVVEDAETPLGQLSYIWTANAGTFTGTGASVTWRHAPGIQQGRDVVITLTVVDVYQVIENFHIVTREYRVVRQAAPFRVHDSVAELKELARKFLIDLFGDSRIPPESCLVDFSEVGRCADGKVQERSDIAFHRSVVEIQSAIILSQSVNIVNPASAVVTSEARFNDRWLSPGPLQAEFSSTHADFYLSAIYDQGRWWLCESTFGNVRGTSRYLDAIRARRGGGGPPVK
jgi:hypothetical protein